MAIIQGMILVSTSNDSPIKGMYRVLQILPSEDIVVVIPIPIKPRNDKHGNSRNYYFLGFMECSLTKLNLWLNQKLMIETTITLPAIWYMSDESIREKFPPRKEKNESSVLIARDKKWELIRPILPEQERTRIFSLIELDKKAVERAIVANVSKGQMLDALHRYFAFGCIKNALIPSWAKCGALDVPRIAKKGKKLGRKNAAVLDGNIELQGKILTEADRHNLKDGWSLFVRPGSTVGEAFLAMSTTFYNSGYTEKFGVLAPTLLPAHMRPTKSEFKYHGPLGNSDQNAIRRLMGDGEWLKNCREMQGTARSGVFNFGQVGVFDASPIDVNLVACFDSTRPIGVGRGFFVTDLKYDLIVGWYVAIGSISAKDALLGIEKGATEKTELLKRYDLSEIPAEDFPYVLFTKYLGDNGEMRCIAGIEAIVEDLGSRLELIKTGRADQNSVAEAGHHSRHRSLDHKLKGTTRGRQRKRGEPLGITQGIWTKYQYERLLILWIHWKNTKQEVPHLLTTEMRRDNVKPFRIEIYRWAISKGYVAGIPKDETYLKSRLLPTFVASIVRNGLVLHRPNKGNVVELLSKARFSDPYLATSGLIRSALNGGKKHIEVKADPDDLSCVYLMDEKGLHVIKNASDDPILVHEGCIDDLAAMNDEDRVSKVKTATKRDQDEADMRAFRVEQETEANNKKLDAISNKGKTIKTKNDRSSVRTNQELEKRAQLDGAVGRASDSVESKSIKHSQPDTNKKTVPTNSEVNSISSLMQKKLNEFHDIRSDK